jgi:signal transduction histidine kinase
VTKKLYLPLGVACAGWLGLAAWWMARALSDPRAMEGDWAFASLLWVVMGAGFAWQTLSLRAALRARAEQEAHQAILYNLVAALPDPWFAWSVSTDAHGPAWQGQAPGFASALGLAAVKSLDDVEQALAPSDAAALHGAFRHLISGGTTFTIEVRRVDGERSFQAVGRRAARDGGSSLLILWLHDRTDEVRKEAALTQEKEHWQAAHQRLLAALDALPLPLWQRGEADLAMNWCNPAFARLLERSPAEVVKGQAELPHIGQGGDPREIARRALATGTSHDLERFWVIEGSRRLLRLHECPVPGFAGRLIGMAQDRTDERSLRDDLDRHVAAHAEVLDQLGSAIVIFGPDLRLKFHNHAYARFWDFDPAFLVGEPLYGEILEDLRARRKLTEEADFPRWKKQQIALFTSLIDPLERLVHLPDGRTLRSLAVPHPFGGLMFVDEDVTQALALESNYNTLMAVQQETLDNLAEGVAFFGGDGRLKLYNPSFQRIWGLGSEKLDNEPHVAHLVENVRSLLDNQGDWQTQKTEIVERLLERVGDKGQVRRTDSSVIRYNLVPLPDGAALFSCLDVTDTHRVEMALRASNEALEAADRLKSEFIANVSYQLRTPLNSIMGFSEILQNQYFGPLNARQSDYVRSVLEAGKRLLALVNDVLDLATIEAGFMVLEWEKVDIGQLLYSVAGLTREWARKQSLELKVETSDMIGHIEGDEKRLKQALFNLVSNAIKFTPAGGRIVLSARREATRVILEVADTGVGIAAEDQERVFERFERGDQAQAGAGLGLSLVRSFIALHGGQVELESGRQAGSVIRCILPMRREQVQPNRRTGDFASL